MGDIKPDPPLWQEENRRPWENRRRDAPGSVSGCHVSDAAHRLVANSLQSRPERNSSHYHSHGPPPPYATSYRPQLSHQPSNYPAQAARDHHHRLPFPGHQPYHPVAAYDPYSRSDSRAADRETYYRPHSHHDRNYRGGSQNRYPQHVPREQFNQQGGYNNYRTHQQPYGYNNNNDNSANYIPPENQCVGRGYYRPPQ